MFKSKYVSLSPFFFLQYVVFFGLLAVASAGHLGSYASVEYAPPTIAKTVEYAAPAAITKAIYQPSPILAKTVYEPDYHHHNYHAHPYQHHHQHEAPSYHGIVSHYGKTVATPHSYVNKYDTRIINDDPHHHYNVAAYPAIVKSPIVPTIVKTPIVKAPLVAAAPIITKNYHSLDHSYDHSYDHAYDHAYDHGHHAYAHASPVLAKAAVAYSPAVAVSHASFESAHGHYAW